MSISPPSDIVLDVARAADPLRRQEAMERLTRLSATKANAFAATDQAGFDDVFKSVDNGIGDGDGGISTKLPITQLPFDATSAMMRLKSDTALASAGGASSVKAGNGYRDFEAMALTTFVESMLPKSGGSSLFGTGTAGEVWRSMMAQQIAGQLAAAGGIGIADQLQAAAERAKSAAAPNT